LYTPGLWTHATRNIQFTLVVDDFGVKYVGKENADHLISCIKDHYKISEDWEGKRYLGLTMDWDYNRVHAKRKVHLSMPGYKEAALVRFGHKRPGRPQNQPHPHVPPNYGAKQQYAAADDTSPLLNEHDKKYIQQVTGVFLYCARAVDSPMLVPLSALASEQSKPTEATMKKCKQFLDYAASQPDAIITYRASDMVLAIHSDASYLSEPKARSRAGGHFFMSENDEFPTNNGAVLNVAVLIKNVMSSAAEAELGAMFINAKQAVHLRRTLEELGHPQPPTPIQTDNTTAQGVVTNNILPKATKSMDMQFHWLRDREFREQFRSYWRSGTKNLGDYWTKHHPGAHHQSFRPEILTAQGVVDALRKILSARASRSPVARVC
jgi:hypothetical protein